MKTILQAIILAFFMSGMPLTVHAPAHAQGLTGILGGNKAGVNPSTYIGPGDIVSSGNIAWFGLRAYSNAAAGSGQRAVNVCLAANTSCTDMVVDVNGNLVVTNVGGSSCGAVTCYAAAVYDQTGHGFCGGACDMVNTGADSTRYIFKINCIGNKPCLQATTNMQALTSVGVLGSGHSTAAGMTMAAYGGSTTTAPQNELGGCSVNFANIGFNNALGVDDTYIFNGTTPYLQAPALTGTGIYHSTVGVANTTSSIVDVDGTPKIGTSTNSGDCVGAQLTMGFTTNGSGTNTWAEFGIWTTIFTGTQASSMSTNLQQYWPCTPGTTATAYLARFGGGLGTPSALETQAACVVLNCLDNNSLTSTLDIFYWFPMQSAAGAVINAISTSFTITPINSPTFTIDRGFTGDGGTNYLDTNFNPTTATTPKYTITSAMIGAYVLTNDTSTPGVTVDEMGLTDNGQSTFQFIIPVFTDGKAYGSVLDNVNNGPQTVGTSQGSWLVSGTGTTTSFYRNGGKLTGPNAMTPTGVGNGKYFILASDGNGTPQFFSSHQIMAAWIGGAAASDAKALAMNSCVNTGANVLGINVY